MRLRTTAKYFVVILALAIYASASKFLQRTNLVDDALGLAYGEEEPYEEELTLDKKSLLMDLVDDNATPLTDRPTLVSRQQAAVAADPGQGANIPMPSIQTQNLTTVQNNTLNNTSGQPSGYYGVAPGQTQQVNCTLLSTGLSNNCWEDLNLTDWLFNWSKNNFCYPNEGFATCFLRQNGFPGYDCSSIAVNRCVPPQAFPWQDVFSFYVSYNIYCKNFKGAPRYDADSV